MEFSWKLQSTLGNQRNCNISFTGSQKAKIRSGFTSYEEIMGKLRLGNEREWRVIPESCIRCIVFN